MRVKINNEIKGNESKSFMKKSNHFYALYKNGYYLANCQTLKIARNWIK